MKTNRRTKKIKSIIEYILCILIGNKNNAMVCIYILIQFQYIISVHMCYTSSSNFPYFSVFRKIFNIEWKTLKLILCWTKWEINKTYVRNFFKILKRYFLPRKYCSKFAKYLCFVYVYNKKFEFCMKNTEYFIFVLFFKGYHERRGRTIFHVYLSDIFYDFCVILDIVRSQSPCMKASCYFRIFVQMRYHSEMYFCSK